MCNFRWNSDNVLENGFQRELAGNELEGYRHPQMMSAAGGHVNPEGTGDIIQPHSFNNRKELQKDPCHRGFHSHVGKQTLRI